MNRIVKRFTELRKKGERALITFITAGDPNEQISADILLELAKSGADIIEVGIPFSDPLADGPSIQSSSQRALRAGMTPIKSLELVSKVRKSSDVPIVLMTYYNPVQRIGVERFARLAVESGADGAIITDLPPEEASDWKKAADTEGICTVFLLAPTSTDSRIKMVAKLAEGFIYCVSRTGVTGARDEISGEVSELVRRVKEFTDKPAAVGFGISKPEHVRDVCSYADAAVVGSAIVDLIAKYKDLDNLLPTIATFTQELKRATIP